MLIFDSAGFYGRSVLRHLMVLLQIEIVEHVRVLSTLTTFNGDFCETAVTSRFKLQTSFLLIIGIFKVGT